MRGAPLLVRPPAFLVVLPLLVGLMIPIVGPLATALLVVSATSLTLLCVKRGGPQVLIEGFMAVAAFTAAFNGVRVAGVFSIADIFLICSASLVLAYRALRPAHSRWRYYRPFLVSAGLIVLGGLLGTLAADQGLGGIEDLVRFALSTLGVLLVFAIWAPKLTSVRLLVWAMLLGNAVNAVVGTLWLKDAAGRAVGLAAHSNHFAIATLLACGAGVGLVLSSSGRGQRIAGGLTAVVAFGMVATGSRAAIAGILAFLFLFLLYSRQWRLLSWCLAAGAAIMVLIVSGIVRPTASDALGRLMGRDPTTALSDEARSEARVNAVETIESRPITGVGFVAARQAHNVYLQLWASAGLLGLAGALGFGFGATRMLLAKPRPDLLLGALVSAFGGYLIAALFSTVLWERYLWLHVAVAVALSSARASRRGEPGPARNCVGGAAAGGQFATE
jgi:O-antigen ligase